MHIVAVAMAVTAMRVEGVLPVMGDMVWERDGGVLVRVADG